MMSPRYHHQPTTTNQQQHQMSSELRAAVVSLLKETRLLQHQNEPKLGPITRDYKDTEHVKLYKTLISRLDDLMVIMNKEEPTTEETLQRQREIQRVRHLVLEQTLTTLPVLRAIHDVQGIPPHEAELKQKMQLRDQLTSKLAKSTEDRTLELTQLIQSNSNLLSEVKELVAKIPPRKPATGNSKELQKKLDGIAEQIYTIIVSLGLDWSEPELQEIVLYCGDIYN